MNSASIPMTRLEHMLKRCFLQHMDKAKKILSSEELSDYISWMATTYGNDPSNQLSVDNVPIFIGDARQTDLANRILQNPNDIQALETLATGYALQREDRYILANHDITVGRMLRYMPAHWHTTDYFEVYYAPSGECPIHFGNEMVTLKQGAVLIVAPGVLHASPCYSDDSLLIYFMVRASTFDRVFWNQLSESYLLSRFFRQALSGGEGVSYLLFDTFADEEISWLVQRIQKEFHDANIYRSQMLNTLMSEFFIMMLQKYEGTARLPRTENFYWKHEFSAIFSFVQTHFADTTIAEVAHKFHYSEKQISRIVRKCMGLSYAQLILKLKMEKAAMLLQQGNMPVVNIAATVGYSDVSCFYRAFTKYFQKTPIAYLRNAAPV